MINIKDFAKVEIRVGRVVKAENKKGSDKLIRLEVDFGKYGKRIMFTGVREYGYKPKDFEDKQYLFVTNLGYRKIMDEESQGMILAVDGEELEFGEHGKSKPFFVEAEGLPLGGKVR